MKEELLFESVIRQPLTAAKARDVEQLIDANKHKSPWPVRYEWALLPLVGNAAQKAKGRQERQDMRPAECQAAGAMDVCGPATEDGSQPGEQVACLHVRMPPLRWRIEFDTCRVRVYGAAPVWIWPMATRRFREKLRENLDEALALLDL